MPDAWATVDWKACLLCIWGDTRYDCSFVLVLRPALLVKVTRAGGLLLKFMLNRQMQLISMLVNVLKGWVAGL